MAGPMGLGLAYLALGPPSARRLLVVCTRPPSIARRAARASSAAASSGGPSWPRELPGMPSVCLTLQLALLLLRLPSGAAAVAGVGAETRAAGTVTELTAPGPAAGSALLLKSDGDGAELAARNTPPAPSFKIVSELPSSALQPTNNAYVALQVVGGAGSLPAGAKYLRLVIDDLGPGGAIARPLEWVAAQPKASRLMFAPVNQSSTGPCWYGTAATGCTPDARLALDSAGKVIVHAEAWTDRRLSGSAGTLLGVSAAIDVHYNYSFSRLGFDQFGIEDTGPGAASVSFTASDPAVAEHILVGTERGLFFFGRFEITKNRTSAGTPIFNRTPQEQFQHPVGKVALSWTQPGIYYVGLFGAWTGDTMHTSLLDPVDGIKTHIFPHLPVAGGMRQFQPLALVVPYANGTVPAVPAGFQGQSHVLQPIVGDKRLAYTKTHLTFFEGAHFYLPMQMPASYDGPPALAVDVDLPAGCTLVSGAGTHVQPLQLGDDGIGPDHTAGTGRHRVRIMGTNKGDAAARLGASAGVGVRFTTVPSGHSGFIGSTQNVSFRAYTVHNASTEDSGTDGWLVMTVAIWWPARAFRPPCTSPQGCPTAAACRSGRVRWTGRRGPICRPTPRSG